MFVILLNTKAWKKKIKNNMSKLSQLVAITVATEASHGNESIYAKMFHTLLMLCINL